MSNEIEEALGWAEDNHAHILDRITAMCVLIRHYIDNGDTSSALEYAERIEDLCIREQEAGF